MILWFAIFSVAALWQEPAPGHWPEFRGPNRDNISFETRLLKQWPEGGPKLLWKVNGIGDGVSAPSVGEGRIFVLGSREGKEWLTALDGGGKSLWSQPIGKWGGEFPQMRYLSVRAPTVDGDQVYACSARGGLSCLKAASGAVVWQKDYAPNFGGNAEGSNFNDSPLIQGKLLLCSPGGSKGTVLALDKATGDSVWQSGELKDPASRASLVPAEILGVRQVVVFTPQSVAGVSVGTGKLLWRADRPNGYLVVPTPVVHDGLVFVTSGFGRECSLFRVSDAGGAFKVEPVYSRKQLSSRFGGVIRVGNHLYGTDEVALKCMEFRTGVEVWADRSVGSGSTLFADGHLIIRSTYGQVALVEATPEGYREKSRFRPPVTNSDSSWAPPVIAGGRLYLRELDGLLCYDLRGPGYGIPDRSPKGPVLPPDRAPTPPKLPDGKVPEAVYIPTPQDVVEAMLVAAKVDKSDLVYDLGSGDGRIVITATKKHGCVSVGFEIVPDLVKLSREKALKEKVDTLVTIRDGDLFQADLRDATVVTLYLGEENNGRLLPRLRKLKPGARIISHAHLLGDAGPAPDRTIKMTSQEDGMEHVIHVWTAPLKGP